MVSRNSILVLFSHQISRLPFKLIMSFSCADLIFDMNYEFGRFNNLNVDGRKFSLTFSVNFVGSRRVLSWKIQLGAKYLKELTSLIVAPNFIAPI